MIHQDIINRYLKMLEGKLARPSKKNTFTSRIHLRWMLHELNRFDDELKASRWLGFIQACLIKDGFTTVEAERNFTRPYFTAEAREKRVRKSIRLISGAVTASLGLLCVTAGHHMDIGILNSIGLILFGIGSGTVLTFVYEAVK